MSGVTLDELLKEVGITPKQLDEKCTDEHLHDIALFLKSWRTLAPHLMRSSSSSEVEAVERNSHGEEEKKQKFLESWKAKFAFKATYRVLVEALLKIGNADQAEQVCHLLVSQQPSKDVSKFKYYCIQNKIGYYAVVTLVTRQTKETMAIGILILIKW